MRPWAAALVCVSVGGAEAAAIRRVADPPASGRPRACWPVTGDSGGEPYDARGWWLNLGGVNASAANNQLQFVFSIVYNTRSHLGVFRF